MKKNHLFRFTSVICCLFIVHYACTLPKTSSAPSVTIVQPADQAIVEVFTAVDVISNIAAPAGLAHVDLYVNDVITHLDTPTSGNPVTHTAIQPFTPTTTGLMKVSVTAYDLQGKASSPAIIYLNVIAAESNIDNDVDSAEEAAPVITENAPSGAENPPVAEATGCTNAATFIGDVTIPDNTVLSSGAAFSKTWRVQNTGTCAWNNYRLVFSSGNIMGGISPTMLGQVAAGATTDITLNLIAPTSNGTYGSTWKIQAADGTLFGTDLTVIIIIPAPATETPLPPTLTPTLTPTNTPTVTPTPWVSLLITLPIGILLKPEVKTVVKQVTVSPGTYGQAVAECPANSVIVSGGWAASDKVFVYNSSISGNGWQVFGWNKTTSNQLLNANAYCITNTGGTASQVAASKSATGNTWSTNAATCPAGSVITGGGFAIKHDGSLELYNMTRSGNGMQIYVNNKIASAQPFNVYAVCLSGVSGSISVVTNTVSVPAGTYGTGNATCPDDKYNVGGGFATNLGVYVYNLSHGTNHWTAYGNNSTTGALQLNIYALCYAP